MLLAFELAGRAAESRDQCREALSFGGRDVVLVVRVIPLALLAGESLGAGTGTPADLDPGRPVRDDRRDRLTGADALSDAQTRNRVDALGVIDVAAGVGTARQLELDECP